MRECQKKKWDQTKQRKLKTEIQQIVEVAERSC